MNSEFDVIIVGGRVAGSHLAARLGKYGFRVLLLERAQLPSLPAVSSPIIYASTMRMLDEIGADETHYAHNTPKIKHMAIVSEAVNTSLRLPVYKGRDYAYAIDRARFDAALWETAINYPTVTGRQNFSVTDLVWDGDTVVGVVGKEKGGEQETFHADAVIGADGRFGIIGRKVDAAETDTFDSHPTSIYYAYWHNVPQVDSQPTSAVYEGVVGTGYYTMDSADGQTVVGVEGRADTVAPDGDGVEAFYLEMLQKRPKLWQRMQDAEMVTSVRGMRNIGNAYKQAGGAGWALVGDAYHQKDPLDGQGIYNAVITGKILARMMLKWKNGDLSWDAAIAEYDELARVKTYPMYKSLQNRIQTTMYTNPENNNLPEWVEPLVGRWLLSDEAVVDLFGKMMVRDMHPDMVTVLTPPTLIGAVARGIRKDVEKEIKKRIPFLN